MSFNGAFLNRHNSRLLRLLRGCVEVRSLDATECLHALVVTMGSYAVQPIFLNNNLISLYATAGELSAARKVFDGMPDRNSVSYNTITAAYVRHGDVEKVWGLFSAMSREGLKPTQHSVVGLLTTPSIGICRAMVMKSGIFYADLLNLYGKNGYLDESVGVFEDMPRKSIVTWNSMLTLFGQSGLYESCGHLFRELKREDAALSECTIITVLSGRIGVEDLMLGEQIHGLVVKNGCCCEASVVNSLIGVYTKCVDPCLAEKLFEELHARDVVSWNVIIGAWAKSGKPERALEIFHRMSADGVLPNQTTFATVVNSCI